MHSTLGGRRWFPWQQHPCSGLPQLNWNILKYLLWAPPSLSLSPSEGSTGRVPTPLWGALGVYDPTPQEAGSLRNCFWPHLGSPLGVPPVCLAGALGSIASRPQHDSQGPPILDSCPPRGSSWYLERDARVYPLLEIVPSESRER